MSTTSKGLPESGDLPIPAPPPGWLPLAENDLNELLSLPPNWNSYGARPIDPVIVRAAREMLHRLAQPHTPRPNVVPTVRGGVQLEWHTGGIDLELEFSSPDHVHTYYEEGESSEEADFDARTDLPQLSGLVARLSPGK
jgi:hypothetical protein